MARLFLGSESDSVASLVIIEQDGALTARDPSKVAATPNELGLGHGSPGGVAVEWVETCPDKPCLYAFVSYWDRAPAEVVTFVIEESWHDDVEPDVALRELDRSGTGGFQAAHAMYMFAGLGTLAVAHYLSGSISLFTMSDPGPREDETTRPPDGAPELTYALALPGPGGAPREVRDSLPFAADLGGGTEPRAHGLVEALYRGPSGKIERWLLVVDAGLHAIHALKLDGGAPRGGFVTSAIAAPEEAYGGCGNAAMVSRIGHRPRHAVFVGSTTLVVAHEFANVVTLHDFDTETGRVSPRRAVVGAIARPPAWPTAAAVLSSMAENLPVPGAFAMAAPFGIYAASEILRLSKDTICVTVRGFCGFSSSLRVLRITHSDEFRVIQDVPCRPNPRHARTEKRASHFWLLVGVVGGIEVFDVVPDVGEEYRLAP
eukprot:CAMPEP_0119285648 /NCGR_PEP_ID=MMETSP1329-20130426/32576_1 /TAXON_ID=114041 /ORGANISM="Genus nov. species nov., Strain RCC1024" /LENGTH=430 /DNA_ID=CAMNT_0007286359 /DNA_START=135 /DNA_END=1424 /DNA_ORIENTATION=+